MKTGSTPRSASAGSSVRRCRSEPPIPRMRWTWTTFTRAGSHVDVRALPELEHRQRPQPVAVVGAARRVLGEETLDRLGPEPSACARPVVEEQLARERLQIAAKPLRERKAEAALAAGRDLRRELRREGAPQRDLRASALLLQSVRQREPELDDTAVEQRRAQLERVRHGRDVRLRKQVAGEVRVQVQELQAGGALVRRRAEQEAGRGERADLGLRCVAPELRTLLQREDLHEPAVSLRPRDGRRLEEARGAEYRRPALAATGGKPAQHAGPCACERSWHVLGKRRCRVALVAGERLVASVADEPDRDLLPRRLADEDRAAAPPRRRAARRTPPPAAAASPRRRARGRSPRAASRTAARRRGQTRARRSARRRSQP